MEPGRASRIMAAITNMAARGRCLAPEASHRLSLKAVSAEVVELPRFGRNIVFMEGIVSSKSLIICSSGF